MRKRKPKIQGDSKFEDTLSKGLLKGWAHHEVTVRYEVPATKHKYTPDFTKTINGIEYFIESKGRFRTLKEAQKYIHVRNSLKEHQRLVFLLYGKNKPMPHAKKRKDGTRQTHEEWLTKNGFQFFYNDKDSLKQILFQKT